VGNHRDNHPMFDIGRFFVAAMQEFLPILVREIAQMA
jgi:hypothetical protein